MLSAKEAPYSRESTKEEWDRSRKRQPSASVLTALNMKKGQYLFVHHPDIYCDSRSCSLRDSLSKKKEGKWRFRHTHPNQAILYRER